MKKLALTSLLIMFAIKSVSACSYTAEYDHTKHITFAEQNLKLLLCLSVFSIVIITIFYFLKDQRNLVFLIISTISFLLAFPTFIVFALYDICGNSAYNVFLYEFIFIGFLLLINVLIFVKDFSQSKNSLP